MRVAIVGSGVSGLAAAHTLRGHADVTLFEAGSYFGGHAHTVDVTLPTARGEVTHGVDTGFLVYNERTYPQLISLLAELGVATAPSDMSFSVQVPDALGPGRKLEWSGSNLSTVFAQRGNLLNRRFLGMLADLLRFNRLTTQIAQNGEESALMQPLEDFLRQHRFGDAFRDWYFLPMLGCIWSCPTDQMLRFPVATMIRFCYNHGLIQVSNRPAWHTVSGGSRHYVDKITAGIADKRLNTPVQLIERDAAGVRIVTEGRAERFDRLILATHSDQALSLLRDASGPERDVLGAISYQPNLAVLHTDARVLPQRRSAWAAWNYERAQDNSRESARVCLHYLLNKLQPMPFEQPVLVSLNPVQDIDPAQVLGRYEYAHPVFDQAAIRAQQRVPELQGQQHTWFCGAWTGYGFHEDGLKSGLQAARQLIQSLPQRQAQAA
ncbi:FAD-dependent oxidoreductase [Curvibacter sp. HBC61]|uniref:FAD-dependent oxidoreductase n=1 Tax=Curvibacter cyanobacteriorum TaxID=3026422 RepID=A0ABT5N018_9BURK|nr:FAD-dependent oxidoreductase [Curvibacter sp. HBC61]MDD0839398.1 FAD-dependent oxidoreductase [Curvibacter sp. HBC61]